MADVFWYGRALENLHGGSGAAEARVQDFLSNTVKIMLVTSTYTPLLDTHEVKTDITNEISGTGYTAGGATLGTKVLAYTAADSWGVARANTTAYALGDVVRPAAGNGHLYRAIVGGTSHSAPPTFPTVSGQTVAEGGGTIIWAEIGRGITVWNSAAPSWPTSTFTTRRGVVYDDTATDKPLLWLVDFGADFSPSAGTFQITWHAALGIAWSAQV